jgi:predicted nucleic acid-binding protein
LLQPLYSRVVVPQAVIQELTDAQAPAALPAWLEVQPDPPSDPTLGFLDPGEKAALILAQLLNADELLILLLSSISIGHWCFFVPAISGSPPK